MLEVKFYDTVDDSLLKFAVIISQSNGKWVFCKHKERDTYEVPGGHREAGENILETAKRELQEETGAVKYEIKPICVYSVIGKTRKHNMICCLAVDPAYRKRGIASILLKEALDKLDRDKDITVSTFGGNDVKGIAPRKLYKKCGACQC